MYASSEDVGRMFTPRPAVSVRTLGFALAAGVPLAFYLATASAHDFWLDSGEFVAAAADLDLSHPPGHPLSAMVGRLIAFLPVGPLALRVAVGGGILAALAAGFLFEATRRTLETIGIRDGLVQVPLALGTAWAVAGSYGFWFQAVRPEVYALHAALVFFALERVIAFEADYPSGDARPLYAASLALGLALANHHFLAFLILPAGAATLARVYALRGARPLAFCAAAVALGLSTYVYLPIRAAASPPLNLGAPTTLSRLYWVVSAQAFQKNTGDGVPDPLATRLLDVLAQLATNLHVLVLLLALAGAYVTLRLSASRRIGFVWTMVLVLHVVGRTWLGFVRGNPDALGYLIPAFAATAVLAVCFVAVVLRQLPLRRRFLPLAVAAAVVTLGGLQFGEGRARASLAQFADTDAFEDALRRRVPARAVLLVHYPQTVFRLWGGEASERLRPDVLVVPIPFLTYPGMVEALAARAPEVRDLLRGYLLEGELRQPDLQTLASRRPVLVELDPRVPPELYETLAPKGLYYEVLTGGATDTDVRLGAGSRHRAWKRIEALLPEEPEVQETREQIVWRHYNDALYFATFGERNEARRATRKALTLAPESVELKGLRDALAGEGTGPLNVDSFRVGQSVKLKKFATD